MATTRNSRQKAPAKTKIAVDFSDTETQSTLPEGDFKFEVDEVEQKVSDNSGAAYLAITFKVQDGEFKGKKVYHNCSLQPQALFNLRGVLEALGFEVPTGVMELDPADLIGEVCGGTVQHEEYEGKTKPRLVEFFPADELEEDTPEPAPVSTKVVKKASAEPDPTPPATKKKTVKKTPAPATVEVGSAVTFTDDEGNELSGKVTVLDDEGNATVKVGKDEWELAVDDLTLA